MGQRVRRPPLQPQRARGGERTARSDPWTARRLRWYCGRARLSTAIVTDGMLAPTGPPRRLGPYDIMMFPAPKAPTARAEARLVFADSPFGVAVTEDGHARYDVEISAAPGVPPPPSSLGYYSVYVAWAATPDLNQWHRLGVVSNGSSRVGSVEFNKFMLVVTAEQDLASTSHDGPTVLSGTSPSGWLQPMLTQPVFHGVTD